jgi:glycosyltransferase involved in cell wall biosynthesis
MTVVLPGALTDPTVCESVAVLVVESETLRGQLIEAGIAPERIRLIYPGVDLRQFRSSPPPTGPFRVLFASSPADPREFEARGIPLLVETARRCPEIEFAVPWRQWGDTGATERALARLEPPPNFRVLHQDVPDMSAVYRSSHATICLFAQGFGKSCPNSVVEGLASGRPAVLSQTCGIGSFVDRAGAGLAVSRDPVEIVWSLRRLRDGYDRFARRARLLAEAHFDIQEFLAAYDNLYSEVARPHAAVSGDVVRSRPVASAAALDVIR